MYPLLVGHEPMLKGANTETSRPNRQTSCHQQEACICCLSLRGERSLQEVDLARKHIAIVDQFLFLVYVSFGMAIVKTRIELLPPIANMNRFWALLFQEKRRQFSG